MHPCLQVQEILAHIFSYIPVRNQSLSEDLEEDRSIVRRRRSKSGLLTLLGLATTCRVFSSPALDVLWSFQPSLFFLMKLLPPDAFKIVSGKDGSVLVSYTEHILPTLFQLSRHVTIYRFRPYILLFLPDRVFGTPSTSLLSRPCCARHDFPTLPIRWLYALAYAPRPDDQFVRFSCLSIISLTCHWTGHSLGDSC